MFKKKITVSWIVQVSILSALAVILYNFPKFKLPFFPSMFSVQFSMLPTIIGGFSLGPIGGVIICIIKFLFKLLTTQTAAVGELVDLIIGLCVVITSSLTYFFMRNKKGVIYGLILGIIVWITSALLLNTFWAIPAYEKLYGLDTVLKMLTVIPGVNESNYLEKFLLFGCLPFNLMMSVVVSLVTYFVYKRIFWLVEKKNQKKNDYE